MKTSIFAILFALTCGCSLSQESKRLTALEETIANKLESDGKKEFHEMFYFSSSKEHQDAIHQEIDDLFAQHFKSGVGKIIVKPLKDVKYHSEVMGEMKADVLYRAPGPPFASLVVYPADEKDPDYMGLFFRLAKIDGEPRIVFVQHLPDVPQFLNGKITTWVRADQRKFDARLVRLIDGVAHFRTRVAPLLIPVTDLSAPDQMRIAALTTKGEQGAAPNL
jgi:hypothetical protein